MDACTRQRHHVNYFAINVRYADEGKYYIKTLAILATQAQNSSKFLTQLEKDVLQMNGLQKGHVLCIVTDNASNMVSMVKQLNERPREGSSVTEESAAKVQEKSGASHNNKFFVCDDLSIINSYD